MTVRVAVDALGGDHGPAEVVAGALDARSAEIEPILFGPRGLDTHGLDLVETTQELSIGEEPEKGNQLTLEAHELIAASGLDFGGNTEGRDLLAGAADVVVTDGFTGNVALKLLEGTIRTLLDAFREEITATLGGKLGGLLIRPAASRLRTRLDPDTYGGAYLLGLRGLVVIAHGNSSRRADADAIRLAARGVEHDVVERLAERVS